MAGTKGMWQMGKIMTQTVKEVTVKQERFRITNYDDPEPSSIELLEEK